MKILRKIAPLVFFFALFFALGTADAWGNGRIAFGQACIQWAISGIVCGAILKAGRII